MKNRKLRKALLALCCAIALVAISVGATLAYLISADTVTNTFTVGNVNITLDELDVDDSDNDNDRTDRDKANTYKLFPGKSYTKDPTVHVAANSENSWIFVKVDNQIADIIDGDLETQIITTNEWTKLSAGLYYKEYTSNTDETDLVVFSNFTIRSDVDNDELANYANKQIIVNAYAIQKEGFTTAATAWAAYQKQTATAEPTTEPLS